MSDSTVRITPTPAAQVAREDLLALVEDAFTTTAALGRLIAGEELDVFQPFLDLARRYANAPSPRGGAAVVSAALAIDTRLELLVDGWRDASRTVLSEADLERLPQGNQTRADALAQSFARWQEAPHDADHVDRLEDAVRDAVRALRGGR